MKALELKKHLYWNGTLDPDLKTFDIIMETIDNAYDLLQKAINMEITCAEAVEKNLVLVQ